MRIVKKLRQVHRENKRLVAVLRMERTQALLAKEKLRDGETQTPQNEGNIVQVLRVIGIGLCVICVGQ